MQCIAWVNRCRFISIQKHRRWARWFLILNCIDRLSQFPNCPLHSLAAAVARGRLECVWSKLRKMFSCWDELNCTTAHFVFRMKFTFFLLCGILETLLPKSFRTFFAACESLSHATRWKKRENFAQLLFFTSILTLFWFLCCVVVV